MATQAELYVALKDDLGALARPLFVRSEQLLKERGYFLPHAAVLAPDGRVSLMGAMCMQKDGFANSGHILPMVHEGLRSAARERELLALGVAERVDAVPGQGAIRAVKVQLEHKRGLIIAFFMPYTRSESGSVAFSRMLTVFSESEVNAW